MNRLELVQLQLLNIISVSLFGGEDGLTEITPELLKEARRQTVLTLVDINREVFPRFFVESAKMLDNNLRNDFEHSEAHTLMTEAGIS